MRTHKFFMNSFGLIFLLVAGTQLNAQVLIQSGARITTTNDVQIVFYNIDVINDDTTSDFSFAHFICTGSTDASIQGTANWLINKLVIDKEGANLKLGGTVNISNAVQMVSGLLDLNNQVLTLLPGARLLDESETSRVVGPSGGIIQTTINIGTPVMENPGNLGAVISSAKDLGTVTVKRWHNAAAAGDAKVNRYYDIKPSNNKGLGARLRLEYLNSELNNISEAGLAIYTRRDARKPWSFLGADAADTVDNFIEKGSLNSLQHYSIGGGRSAFAPEAQQEIETQQNMAFAVPIEGKSNNMKISVGPSPTTSNAYLNIQTPVPFKTQVKLVGTDGKIYHQQDLNLTPGNHRIELNFQRMSKGLYYVIVRTPDGLSRMSVVTY